MTLTSDDFHPALDRRGNSELVRLIGELDHFRGTWRKMQEIRTERLAQLRQVTTIESTASSTRIEGVELTDAEVARVLEGIRSESFRTRDEASIHSRMATDVSHARSRRCSCREQSTTTSSTRRSSA